MPTLAGLGRRWPTLLASAGIAAAAVAAAVLTQPAALAQSESRSRAAYASLASAGIVAGVVIPITARRRTGSRTAAVAAAVITLALGITAFVSSGSIQRKCTLQYDGRAVLIGPELTELGRTYVHANPQLAIEEVLRDSRGDTETVWTRQSIGQCRVMMAGTYFLWLPFLIASLVSAAIATPAARLSVPAAPAAAAVRAPAVIRYDAFISYRHGGADAEIAQQVLDALEADGYKVAIDERDFAANANFLLEMERCIRESRYTIAIVSARYLDSGHCEEEAIVSKGLDMSDRRRRLIPFIVQAVEMPAWLFGLVGIDCTKQDALVDPIDKLKATLGAPGREAPPAGPYDAKG